MTFTITKAVGPDRSHAVRADSWEAAMQVQKDRAWILNRARPTWTMVGLEWDGPGVLLMASDKLSSAKLDFEAGRVYEFRDIADLMRNFRPSLALSVTIETSGDGGEAASYVLIAAPDWPTAIRELLSGWTPGQGELLELPAKAPLELGEAE